MINIVSFQIATAERAQSPAPSPLHTAVSLSFSFFFFLTGSSGIFCPYSNQMSIHMNYYNVRKESYLMYWGGYLAR